LNPTKFFYFFQGGSHPALNRSGQGLAEKSPWYFSDAESLATR
jgi:hypothetical protein